MTLTSPRYTACPPHSRESRIKQFGGDMQLDSPEFDRLVLQQDPTRPCHHRPGSPEKVAMLCARAAHMDSMISLWHPEDKVDHTPLLQILVVAAPGGDYEDDEDYEVEDDE